MATASNAFHNQLNLLTGLHDLRKIKGKDEETKDEVEPLPSLPKDINSLLDDEYKTKLYAIVSAIRRGEITRPTLKNKLHNKQSYIPVCPDAAKEAKKNIEYIQTGLDRLNLTSSNVQKIDSAIKKFTNLKELNLVGNQISKVNTTNLPISLEILHLNCNLLIHSPKLNIMSNLVHLGLAYNKITSLSTSTPWLPPNLKSLDLSFNDIVDLNETISQLKETSSLRCLVLAGNPACLCEGYRKLVTSQLTLRVLDDVAMEEKSTSRRSAVSLDNGQSIEALSSSSTEELASDVAGSKPTSASKSRPTNMITKLLIDFSSIKDLPAPPLLLPEEVGQPANEYIFGLRVLIHGYDESEIHSTFSPWQEGVMAFGSKIVLDFQVSTKFRNALKHKEGLTIQLVQRRIRYDLKPEPEVEEPVAGKKAKVAAPVKKKKGAAFTLEELEAGYDATISEERILWTRAIDTQSFLDGVSDRILCDGGLLVELPQDLLDELAELAAIAAEAAKKKKGKNAVFEVPVPLKTEASVDLYLWPDQSSLASDGVSTFVMG